LQFYETAVIALSDLNTAYQTFSKDPSPTNTEKLTGTAAAVGAAAYAITKTATESLGGESKLTQLLTGQAFIVGSVSFAAGMASFLEALNKYNANPSVDNANAMVQGMGELVVGTGNLFMGAADTFGLAGVAASPALDFVGISLVGIGSGMQVAGNWSASVDLFEVAEKLATSLQSIPYQEGVELAWTRTTTTNADGSTTQNYQEYFPDYTIARRYITTTSPDGKTITTNVYDGNGSIIGYSATTKDSNGIIITTGNENFSADGTFSYGTEINRITNGYSVATTNVNETGSTVITGQFNDSGSLLLTIDPATGYLTNTTTTTIYDPYGTVIGQGSSVKYFNGASSPIGSTTTFTESGVTTQTVDTFINGHEVNATYTYDESGQPILTSVNSIDGIAPTDSTAALEAFKNLGLSPEDLVYGDATGLGAEATAAVATFNAKERTGAQILTQSVTSVIDALTLLKAIQTGEPLPIVVSGLRLANDLTTLANNGIPYTNLNGAASLGSGILSLMSLNEALKQGDTLAAVTAGAQTVYFGATAYANFLGYTSDKMGSAVSKAFPDSGLGQLGDALPYLNLVNSIAHGDEIGAGVAVVDLALMNAGVYSVPYIGWAYAVYSIVDSLFGGHDDIPAPWGNGHYVWNGTGITYQSVGETGGNEAVSNVMSSVLSTMNALIERERQQNPGSQLGITPNRMPSVAYDMSGYRYTDIDPLTGAEQHPYLRFDTSGNPYNAEPGSPESYQSIVEGIVYSALSRGAIAPLWEVRTAAIQTQYGDPKAGLTEEERAGRDGQLGTQDSALDTQILVLPGFQWVTTGYRSRPPR
jgi:hypothetical protein